MNNVEYVIKLNRIQKKIEGLKTKNKNYLLTIKSLDYVKNEIWKEYTKCSNEVEFLETKNDIKKYIKYKSQKESLEKEHNAGEISDEKFIEDMTTLQSGYTDMNSALVCKYVTITQKARNFKSQYVEICSSKECLLAEIKENESKIGAMYREIAVIHNENSFDGRGKLKPEFEENGGIFGTYYDGLVNESLATCMD